MSPSSKLTLITNNSTHPTLKTDLSDHPFIKDDIFEANVNFPIGGTPIGIISKYCEHHNMPYIYQSKNNSRWKNALSVRNRTNVWILSIGSNKATTFQQALEAI